MAIKVTISQTLTWTDGKDTLTGKASAASAPAGTNVIESVQTIGTSAEPIDLGDVQPGWILFRNQDATNYVEIGTASDVTNPQIKLGPGEGVLMPTEEDTWYAKANTAAVDLLVMATDA